MTEQPPGNETPLDPAEQLRAAIGLQQRGQLNEAQALCERILRGDPGHAAAAYLLGLIAYQRRQFAAAIASMGRAISLNPENAAFRAGRGLVLQEMRQFEAAIADYDAAIAAKSDYAEAYNNRGNAHQALNKLDAALADYGTAIALRPDYAEAYLNRGNALQQAKRLDAAIADYDKVIALRPDLAAAYYNRGSALRELRRPQAAIADYDRVIALKPDYAEAYNNRGVTQRDAQNLEAAIADYDRAIALKPDYAEAYNNRGIARQELKQLAAAIADYDQAIALKPDYASAYWNKALTLLLGGDLAAGFELYEWRWKNPNLHLAPRRFAQPLWLGEAPLRGKTMLLHSEQGLGDTIQFCRYAALAAQAGAQVILEVPQSLAALLKNLAGVSCVVAQGEPLPAFDIHCPLMSLPLAFKTTLAAIPDPTPYLHADPAKMRAWRERIGARKRLKVGVVWSGGARPGASEAWGDRRNVPLDILARALGAIDADFFSLQKGDPAEADIRGRESHYWPRGNFQNFAGEIDDFSDTAAFVANLDLVLSVETATAHLAAALGKPSWILLRFDTDWRWLLERQDSPWYRSVKLYRQDESQSWEPVLRRVAADLRKLASFD